MEMVQRSARRERYRWRSGDVQLPRRRVHRDRALPVVDVVESRVRLHVRGLTGLARPPKKSRTCGKFSAGDERPSPEKSMLRVPFTAWSERCSPVQKRGGAWERFGGSGGRGLSPSPLSWHGV